jgi:hypothetical protein
LTIFAKNNELEFTKTLSNLVFGSHIGKANNYSETELNELMSVLLFENIGFCRLDLRMKNAYKVHPIVSKEIVQYAGISNKLVLESILQHEEKLDGSGYPNRLTKIHEYAQISQIANQHSLLIQQHNDSGSLLGNLFMSGQSCDFRTGDRKSVVYESKLQKALLNIMQEKLNSPLEFVEYAGHLHQQLSNIIKWSYTQTSTDEEVMTIQKKIKSALWIDDNIKDPFQVSSEELSDLSLCKEFITDAMSFMHQIVESANYLNRNLHSPIEINGSPISGESCLNIANPNRF